MGNLSFLFQITEYIPIHEICRMYSPYHEMDIRQFCKDLSELYIQRKQYTNLKQKRMHAHLSQSQLAQISGIPVRTLQQYEHGHKNINKAR